MALPTSCPPGMSASSQTRGHCCWPGQVWSEGVCRGIPASCEAGFEPTQREICEPSANGPLGASSEEASVPELVQKSTNEPRRENQYLRAPRRLLGRRLAIVGGLSLAIGSVLVGMGWADAAAVERSNYYPDVRRADQRARRAIPSGFALTFAGLSSLVVGCVLLRLEIKTQVLIAVGLSPNGIEVRGDF